MTTENKIIEEVLKDFVEKHEFNLKNIGGWDKNDFVDYSKQLLTKALQSQKQKIIEEIERRIEFWKPRENTLNREICINKITELKELLKTINFQGRGAGV